MGRPQGVEKRSGAGPEPKGGSQEAGLKERAWELAKGAGPNRGRTYGEVPGSGETEWGGAYYKWIGAWPVS